MKYAIVGAPAVFAAAMTLLSLSAIADERHTYAEPYPYHKSSGAQGYQLYPVHGCNDYEITGSGPVRHICDRRSPSQIFKTSDREGLGVGDATAAAE